MIFSSRHSRRFPPLPPLPSLPKKTVSYVRAGGLETRDFVSTRVRGVVSRCPSPLFLFSPWRLIQAVLRGKVIVQGNHPFPFFDSRRSAAFSLGSPAVFNEFFLKEPDLSEFLWYLEEGFPFLLEQWFFLSPSRFVADVLRK